MAPIELVTHHGDESSNVDHLGAFLALVVVGFH
jgi:hypothetical protein